jgi:Fe2+ or Zn2+ uptake regulation protein
MAVDDAGVLREHGISPSAQRVAVAKYVLHTDEHPSADEVWTRVQQTFPQISRATVYNTLNLFVEKRLLRPLALTEGKQVFDPNMEQHHHFIDEESGEISDIPWDAIAVGDVSGLKGYDVSDYQVVMRGRRVAAPE